MGFGTIFAAGQERIGCPGGSAGPGPGAILELAGFPIYIAIFVTF